jgi:hypothetical protein
VFHLLRWNPHRWFPIIPYRFGINLKRRLSIKFCMKLIIVMSDDNYCSQRYRFVYWYYNRLLPLIRQLQTEWMSLWSSDHNISPPAWIISAGIWAPLGDLCFFYFLISNSASKAVGSGTNGSSVCISSALSSWEKYFFHLFKMLWKSVSWSPFSSSIHD